MAKIGSADPSGGPTSRILVGKGGESAGRHVWFLLQKFIHLFIDRKLKSSAGPLITSRPIIYDADGSSR